MKWETAIEQILRTNQSKKQMIHKTTKHELTNNSQLWVQHLGTMTALEISNTSNKIRRWLSIFVLGCFAGFLLFFIIIYHLFVQDLWWPPSSRASLQTTCRTTSSKYSGAQLVALLVLFIGYTQFLTFVLSLWFPPGWGLTQNKCALETSNFISEQDLWQ